MWISALQATHAKFTGQKGTFAQFGDSITDTLAYWTPLLYSRKNASPEMERAFDTVKGYMRPECWRDWKGPDYGNQGGQTAEWALDNVDAWLKKLNPEVVLIMFGTNDLRNVTPADYRTRMQTLAQRCLDNGNMVILSTIPPKHGMVDQAKVYADIVRQLAAQMNVPLIDFQAEILKRRPDDWDGAIDKFNSYDGYDVPTLISRDGTHPSLPKQYADDYSDEGLSHSGYNLRSYLTLMEYAAVIDALNGKQPTVQQAAAPSVGQATVAPAVSSPAPAAAKGSSAPYPSAFFPIQPSRFPLTPPEEPWFPKAPPLPPPTGQVIQVSTPDELVQAAADVKPGGTILLTDGYYLMKGLIRLQTDGITLRGASGHPDRVVLDADGRGEMIWLSACKGVTIADLTVENVKWNGIKLNSETGVQQATIYHCILHNIWQRAIKGVMVPVQNREQIRPTGCRIQYCLFYNDHAKRPEDDSTDTDATFQGNYIAGIDVMYARDWTISDNVFIGIQGRTREARGAIFLWQQALDCVVERNTIIDCDSGICLGNSARRDDGLPHCVGVVARNNFVTRCPEGGIVCDYTKDCKVLSNSIFDPQSRLGRLIRLVHDNDGLVVANNLLGGPPIRIETTSHIQLTDNRDGVPASAFRDPAHGDLRPAAAG